MFNKTKINLKKENILNKLKKLNSYEINEISKSVDDKIENIINTDNFNHNLLSHNFILNGNLVISNSLTLSSGLNNIPCQCIFVSCNSTNMFYQEINNIKDEFKENINNAILKENEEAKNFSSFLRSEFFKDNCINPWKEKYYNNEI